MNNYGLMVFVEEGMKAGGFGEYVAELAQRRNCSCRLLVLAVGDQFEAQGAALGKREELLRDNGLDGEGIALSVKTIFSPLVGQECVR
jgi:1-deoxy-D-xylulose-5-phosphate synthase